MIAYGIGQLIGAPVPANALIEIPAALDWEYADAYRLHGGTGHGSLNVEDVVVVEEWGTYSRLDDNRRRQALILALWDLCMGVDPQWLHQTTEDYSIWSFDHGFWLAGESDWTIDSLKRIGTSAWQFDLDLGVASAGGLHEAADRLDGNSGGRLRRSVRVRHHTTGTVGAGVHTVPTRRGRSRATASRRQPEQTLGRCPVSYQYWIIRFVPNVARGEFTNVGILCGRDGGDWAVGFDPRYVRNHGNLSSDLREPSSWITWFRRTIERHSSVGFGEQSVSSGWIAQLSSRQMGTKDQSRQSQ